ncbi:MAG: DNA primase [Bacteroidia bacterium]|jgi:DNA primase
MIPQAKIEEILDAAHIEDVVAEYVSLRKRGSSLIGLCPFHNEKTPSFNVSVTKGIFKCFGCGKAGNSVNFIMEYEHLGYIEALKHLAEKYRIEWPEKIISDEDQNEERRKKLEKESLQILNNFSESYFAQILEQDEEGIALGLSYFEERGFRPETIHKFKLGYSKESWDHFTQKALSEGYSESLLITSGLAKKSEAGKVYDAYRNRVIFPIHGLNGKPIAFAGRILKNKDEKSPKYVNSPETSLYHKSNELYGLFQARTAIAKQDFVYLVEGYTDVISMHQSGVENVVASSGTSLTENQIRLIKRFTENVCVLYDGDAAGIKASLRGIDMLLEGGLNVKVVLFPDGEDPDSFCRKQGSQAFSQFLEQNKQDFILFKTSLLSKEAGNDPVKKAELIRSIIESITKIPDAFKRSNFIKECSVLLKTDEQLLVNETNKMLRNRLSVQARTGIEAPPEQTPNYESEIKELVDVQSQESQEKDLLRVLIRYGDRAWEGYDNTAIFIFHELAGEEMDIELAQVSEILNLLHAQLSANEFDPMKLLQHADPRITSFMTDLMTEKHEVSPNWEKRYDIVIETALEHYKSDVLSAITRLKLKHLEKMIEQNQIDFNQAQTDEDFMGLQKVHMHLIEKRKELTSSYGTAIIK